MSDAKWERNDEAERMVGELVAKYHRHLDRAHILCLTKPKASKKNGRLTWATCQKVTPLIRALIEPHEEADYVIVIAGPIWEKLSTKERLALIDHELMHAAGYDDEHETWVLDGHDIEEFASIVERHGAWRPDVQRFLEITRSLPLPQLTIEDSIRANAQALHDMGATLTTGEAPQA